MVDPSLVPEGYVENKCSRCDETERTIIGKLPHTEVIDAAVAPTCTATGYTTYTCECGESYVDDYTDALGHTMTGWHTEVAAKPGVAGLEVNECSVCGADREEREIAAIKLAGFNSASVTLESNIAMNYKIKADYLTYDSENTLLGCSDEVGGLTLETSNIIKENLWKNTNVEEVMQGIDAVIFKSRQDFVRFGHFFDNNDWNVFIHIITP